jgi:hypothetical protein
MILQNNNPSEVSNEYPIRFHHNSNKHRGKKSENVEAEKQKPYKNHNHHQKYVKKLADVFVPY